MPEEKKFTSTINKNFYVIMAETHKQAKIVN